MIVTLSFYLMFVFYQIMDYVHAKEDFLTKYLRHLGTSAIMDLLLRMVNGNPGANMGRSNLSLVSAKPAY